MTNIHELPLHILNTPNFTSGIGALRAALRLSPSIVRESTGSITPSSHSLQNRLTQHSSTVLYYVASQEMSKDQTCKNSWTVLDIMTQQKHSILLYSLENCKTSRKKNWTQNMGHIFVYKFSLNQLSSSQISSRQTR